jgi:ATP-binding cassette, subfamily B, bacterial
MRAPGAQRPAGLRARLCAASRPTATRTWRLLTYCHRTQPRLTRRFLMLVTLSVASSVGLFVALGLVYAAVTDQHRSQLLLRTVLLIGCIVVADTVPPFVGLVTGVLTDRIRADVSAEVARSCLAGNTAVDTGHVVGLVNRSRGAHRNDLAIGVVHAFQLLGVVLTGALLTLVAVGFGGAWQAVALALSTALTSRHLSRRLRDSASIWTRGTEEQKRFDYLYWLGVEGAVKEVRVFRLKRMLLGQYDAYWHALAAKIWASRRTEVRHDVWAVLAHLTVLVLCLLASLLPASATDLAATTIAVTSMIALAGLQAGYSSVAVARGDDALAALRELRSAHGAGERERHPAPATAAGMAPRHSWSRPAEIEFSDVWFTYPGGDSPVLRGVDLILRRSEPAAIVGGNGAGKSTVLKLLMGFHRPDRGTIRVDGVDLATFDDELLQAWQRSVALVAQHPMRLPMSLRANVDVRPRSAGWPQQAADALTRRLLEGLPEDPETILDAGQGEGTGLSGGQWQRVALLRALRRRTAGAGVALFDEPVSALDVEAEAGLVARYVEYGEHMITLTVSHRLSIVRRARRIHVLDGGRIVESGRHAALLAEDGIYAGMFRAQASHFEGVAHDPHG